MKRLWKFLKAIGVALLIIIVLFLSIYWSAKSIDKALKFSSHEEVVKTFGPFEPNQVIKINKVSSVKMDLVGMVGSLIPTNIDVGNLMDVNLYSMAYKSDSLIVTGVLVTPKKEGKFPCIIYNRGGNRDFGKLDLSAVLIDMAPLASGGYVVIASDYRGNNGSEGMEEFGGSDVNDVLNLINVLGDIESADTTKIGMFGHSRGGMMTYMALTRTNKIKTAVVASRASDLINWKKDRPRMEEYVFSELIPDYEATKTQALRERSANYWADKINKSTSLLLIHATNDKRVNYNQASQLADSLSKYKHPFKFVTCNSCDHSMINQEVIDMIKNWFDKYLNGGLLFNELNERESIK